MNNIRTETMLAGTTCCTCVYVCVFFYPPAAIHASNCRWNRKAFRSNLQAFLKLVFLSHVHIFFNVSCWWTCVVILQDKERESGQDAYFLWTDFTKSNVQTLKCSNVQTFTFQYCTQRGIRFCVNRFGVIG